VTFQEYAAAWAALHGGYDPRRASPLIRGWARMAYSGGSRLGRSGVRPATVTAAGLVLCAGVPAAVPLGPAGLLLGALLVLLAGVADAFDGAVAVITGTASRLGFVVDSVADRLGELAWLLALRLAGAPGWLVVAAGAVSLLHEYVRARAAAAGMAQIGAVTVGERPARVALTVAGLVVGGVAGLARPSWAAWAVSAAAAAWLLSGVAGLGQLGAAVRRALS
jgi:phosphatidylglycerophosphate synthase